MTMKRNNRAVLVAWAPWIFVLLWSTGFVAAKFTIQNAPPFKLLFLRGAFSCLVFLLITLALRASFPSLNGVMKQLKAGLLLQAMFLGGCFYAIHGGMPASMVALITGIQPMLTAVITACMDGERMPARGWIGIFLGFIGVYMVLSPGQHHFPLDVWAVVAACVGLIGVTFGSLYQKRVGANGHMLSGILFQYVSLSLCMGVLACFEDQPVQWSLPFAAGLAWLVVGVSVTAILLLIFMIQSGEATKVATYFYLVPVVTAIEAWALFGEAITPMTLAGMAVAICGMLLVIRSSPARA